MMEGQEIRAKTPDVKVCNGLVKDEESTDKLATFKMIFMCLTAVLTQTSPSSSSPLNHSPVMSVHVAIEPENSPAVDELHINVYRLVLGVVEM